MPGASPCALRAPSAAGSRDAARQARRRNQRSAISCARPGGAPHQLPAAFFLVRVLSAAPPESLPTGRARVPWADSQQEPSPGSADRRLPHRERGTGGAQHPQDLLPAPSQGNKTELQLLETPRCPSRSHSSISPGAAASTAGLAGESRAVRARQRLAGNKMKQDELTGSLARVDRGCLLASQPTCKSRAHSMWLAGLGMQRDPRST